MRVKEAFGATVVWASPRLGQVPPVLAGAAEDGGEPIAVHGRLCDFVHSGDRMSRIESARA
jgi:hypothetical protein